MFETIREYAAGLTDDESSDDMRRRHADFYLHFAETKGLRDEFEQHADELRAEQDNFRAALATLRDAREPGAELRLARALARFWYRDGHLREGLAHLDQVLAHSELVPEAVACDAYGFASYIATELGERAAQRRTRRRNSTSPAAAAALRSWQIR